jgi:hypothetical protein
MFPRSYATDAKLERKQCDERRQLSGLDAAAMREAWTTFRQSPRRYNLLDHNCSTVIAVLLEIGSNIKPAEVPRVAIDDHAPNRALRLAMRIRFLSSSIQMWTPDGVLLYADQILRQVPRR